MALTIPSLDNTVNIDELLKTYRDSLKNQYGYALSDIENSKRLSEAAIMAGANQRGMMYSNFPERDKLQYQTSSYLPGIITARNTYQTGLDKLRSNAVSVANDIKSVEEAIADLNKNGI